MDSSYDYVNRLRDLQRAQKPPQRFTSEFPPEKRDLDGLKLPEDFDVMEYFGVLSHLKVMPGKALDWVYLKGDLGGFPVLYVRSASDPPYRYFSELPSREGERLGWTQQPQDYLLGIETDGSEAGFVQLAVLAVVGGQFYQIWHAGYNDLTPVCNKHQLWDILARMKEDNPFFRMPVKDRLRSAFVRTRPRVRLTETTAQVELLVFSCWGGFQRQQFTFSRTAPCRLLDRTTKTVVAYDCGVMF